MKCPNCGANVHAGDLCSKCGIDAVLFEKIENISNILYNKGLICANNNDLSGAMDALLKSIEINKNNYIARNLLGLVYFETGQIGEALKHWVISNALMKENNKAQEYIKIVQNSGRNMEKLNDAVHMYNQALVYAQQNSEDMAIIQLKKAIEINPKFITGYNLLTLCLYNIREYDKAIVYAEKALKLDVNNKIAMNYYLLLKPNSSKTDLGKTYTTKNSSNARARTPHTPRPIERTKADLSFPFTAIISFIVGAACVAAILYILVIPEAIAAKDEQISTINEKYVELEKNYTTETTEKDKQISTLQKENSELNEKTKQLTEQQELQERIQKLHQVSIINQSGDLEKAAETLKTVDTKDFPNEEKELYDTLVADIYPKVARKYYDSGRSEYNRLKYDEAKTLLEKCLIYGTNENFNGDALYFLGRIAENNNEDAQAKIYFERVINEFPGSANYQNARARIQRLL